MARKPVQMLATMLAMMLILTLATACPEAEPPPAKVPPDTAPAVTAGRAVFDQHCNACHPGGGQGAGPALRGRNLPEDEIRTVVRQGAPGMPAFGENQINEQQLTNLVQYIQSLQ
jgi:cytochrome c6